MMARFVNRVRPVPRVRRDRRADVCTRIPVCLLDKLRAGEAVRINKSGKRFGLFAGEAKRPLATRKKFADVEKLLEVAREEAARAGAGPDAAELERRRRTRIITPQRPHGEPGRYQLVEAAELVASHDPQSFAPDPRYPEGVQERDYHRQPEEQRKVVMGGQNLDPALVLTDTPSAVDGPPLVTEGPPWLAMGGNGRSMMLRRAYDDGAAGRRYRRLLLDKAGEFGFQRSDVEALSKPILVRVLEELRATSPAAELVAAVRRLNEGLTQQLSPRARAVAEARVLSPATVESIGELLAGAGDASLRDVMRDKPAELVAILERDGIINAQNRAQWVLGAELTDEAKDRLEGLFLGRVIGTGDRLAATSPSLLRKLERAVPHLIRVAGLNPDLDEILPVRGAIDLLNDAARRGLTLDDLIRQTSLFGDGVPADPEARALAHVFDVLGQRELGQRFRSWAQYAAVDPRQVSMFGETPTRGAALQILTATRQPNPQTAPVVTSKGNTTERIAKDMIVQLGAPPASGHVVISSGGRRSMLLYFHEGKCRRFWLDGSDSPALRQALNKDLRKELRRAARSPKHQEK